MTETTEARAAPATDDHYRAHLDGLRMVAVLLVIAFHSGIGRLSGGFIGVDVFFVLSGFLVTGILAREIGASTGFVFAGLLLLFAFFDLVDEIKDLAHGGY